jgi:hypothetical protein
MDINGKSFNLQKVNPPEKEVRRAEHNQRVF